MSGETEFLPKTRFLAEVCKSYVKLKEDILAEPLQIHNGFIKVADMAKVQADSDLLREGTVIMGGANGRSRGLL